MDRSPYAPPASDALSKLPDQGELDRCKGRVFAIIGVIFFSGALWGLAGSTVQMIEAFKKLGLNNGVDPGLLARDISGAIISMVVGGAVGLVGVVLVLIAFFRKRNREKWFFWWVVLLSAFWCLLSFPFGIIVGAPIGILFIARRAEFRPQRVLEQGLDGKAEAQE